MINYYYAPFLILDPFLILSKISRETWFISINKTILLIVVRKNFFLKNRFTFFKFSYGKKRIKSRSKDQKRSIIIILRIHTYIVYIHYNIYIPGGNHSSVGKPEISYRLASSSSSDPSTLAINTVSLSLINADASCSYFGARVCFERRGVLYEV